MPVDTAIQNLLDGLGNLGTGTLNQLSPAEARELMEGFIDMGTPGPEMASVEDRTVPGPGGEIPVRVYLPAAETPRAGLVYFHGGGWVIGSIRTHDATCRHLAHVSGAAVVSVEYRLAPEHRYPAAAED